MLAGDPKKLDKRFSPGKEVTETRKIILNSACGRVTLLALPSSRGSCSKTQQQRSRGCPGATSRAARNKKL